MKATLRPTAAALLVALAPMAGTFIVLSAATTAAAAQPAITNISINSDAGVAPGATLRVQLTASPDARRASLTLGDSGIVLPLKEQESGVYSGSYVVRTRDRIDPTQMMTARIVVGERALTRQFRYPPSFQALAMRAPAQPQAAGTRMAIERFFIRSTGPVEPGRELRFRLVGAPGADAWMDIPGVIQGVGLRETSPGEYEGTYTVRQRDDPEAFRQAVATLRRGDDRVTARLQFNQPPQITELLPANGDRVPARGRTHIAARMTDDGGGIDPSRVRLRLNGRDVTADARITPDEVHFRADLEPGRYAVELTARDLSGNMTTKTWNFDVVPDRSSERRDAGRGADLPLQVTSHRNETMVDADGNLLIQGRTVPYANVRVQVEQTAAAGPRAGVPRDVFDETVQADRNGLFSAAVQPRGRSGTLPGTRFDVRVTANSGNQSAQERITLIQRQI